MASHIEKSKTEILPTTSASGLKSQVTKGLKSAETEKVLPIEESYTQRRMLFKDIWETAMTIDEKEDVLTKPKVIKTLRLDEVDKMVVGKSRKQRIKNLRHVCKRILEFCDRQDADDKFYEQFIYPQFAPTTTTVQQTLKVPGMVKIDLKSVKKKTPKKGGKKKVKKITSLFNPQREVTVMKATVSERKKGKRRTSKVTSPISRKKTSPINVKTKAKSKSPGKNSPAMPVASNVVEMKKDPSTSRKKPVKKKHSKKKNMSHESTLQALSNMLNSRTAALARRNIAKVNSVKPPETQTLTKQLSTTAVEINRIS